MKQVTYKLQKAVNGIIVEINDQRNVQHFVFATLQECIKFVEEQTNSKLYGIEVLPYYKTKDMED